VTAGGWRQLGNAADAEESPGRVFKINGWWKMARHLTVFGLRWQSEAATALFDGTTPPVAWFSKRRRASLAAAVQNLSLDSDLFTRLPASYCWGGHNLPDHCGGG